MISTLILITQKPQLERGFAMLTFPLDSCMYAKTLANLRSLSKQLVSSLFLAARAAQ